MPSAITKRKKGHKPKKAKENNTVTFKKVTEKSCIINNESLQDDIRPYIQAHLHRAIESRYCKGTRRHGSAKSTSSFNSAIQQLHNQTVPSQLIPITAENAKVQDSPIPILKFSFPLSKVINKIHTRVKESGNYHCYIEMK
jgi:hypothetical protein